jgi:putative hemolysin/Tol biopolymer transport system component
MIRRASLTLFTLICIVLSASCSPHQTSPTPVPNMPNPASVYCEQNGGKLELRQDPLGGVGGVCHFPDGSECEEWVYLRSECRPGNSLLTPELAVSSTPLSPTPTPTVSPATMSLSPTLMALPPTASPLPTPKPTVLHVAYFGSGHIMLWTEGKGARPLADAKNVEQVGISDDGQLVAYLERNSLGIYEIFAINADGTNPRLLAGQDYLQNIQPADRTVFRRVLFDFAPASRTLYFVTEQYDLHRVNAASGSPTPIFGAGKGGFFSFSPDGQWMTLYHPNELVLAHLDGSAARVVFQYPEDFRYTVMGPEIIWRPDSSGFHMVSASGPQESQDNMTVWFVPVAGEPVKQMSYTGPYGANLSPDGRTVAYLYDQHEPADIHIVTADRKDTAFGSYASQSYVNLNFMGWAPDSKHFLLDLSKDGRLVVPYLCAVGEQPVKLTDTDDALPVVWIDAQRVLFASHGKALHLQRVGAPSILLDADASPWFDYTYINP